MRNKGIFLLIYGSFLAVLGSTFSTAAQFCPVGDLTNDCEVDSRDVAAFGTQWLDPQGTCSGSECANLDGINGVEAVDFVMLADDWRKKGEGLIINEFMASNTTTVYDPVDMTYPDWIELYNATDATIDLSGMYLTDNLSDPNDYQIPAGVTIASGQYLIFWADGQAYQGPTHTNFELNADGDEVGLADVDGATLIDGVDFDDLPQTTDISYGRYPNAGDNWRYLGTPTPGDENQAVSVPPLGAVVFNEILSHSHLQDPDWIELYNTTDTAINLSGWFLTDSGTDLKKYEIPEGTIIDTDGYVVFYENQTFGDGNMPGCHTPFRLSENGETVSLRSAVDGLLTGYIEEQEFRAAESNVAFGKYYKESTKTYNFVAMSTNTPGMPNAYPKVGPVVINEIMYHPPDPPPGAPSSDDADYEYVELLNISGAPIVLYDTITNEPWRFTDEPTNPTLNYFFPSDVPVVMADGEYILLVRNLAAFNYLHGGSVPSGTKIFEWVNGKLSNCCERPQIWKPGDVDGAGVRQYIRIDRVSYSDGHHPDDFSQLGFDPWPPEPDGLGAALCRSVPQDYGNDVANWQACAPNPGSPNP